MQQLNHFFALLIVPAVLIFSSCGEKSVSHHPLDHIDPNDIVVKTYTDSKGKQLELAFNNTKESVAFIYEGKSIELFGQHPASGIWYKDDTFELRGKGEEIELKKDGETVFSTGDEVVESTATSKEGTELSMVFNNSRGTASLTLNGEVIELTAERAASGIWYTNDTYELRGKGEQIELKKNGKIVFTTK
ncbi:MliC family protein [Crocinitomicaceae bacterium CZZ-1]|uniref:MliC family protein n=1 Tax=Taishania pollutisoli TaxID=2766479 RepID=A0A8J6TWY9_9FLAO|nr:MliC family protein [Taishania pollutisoli]MBC9811711.1 MliC family protein [Taishania pollutisoli]